MSSIFDEVERKLKKDRERDATFAVFGAIGGIVAVIAIFALAIGASLYKAWIVTTMWAWFFVPEGVPQISYLAALGLSLVLGLVFYNPLKVEKEFETTAERITTLLVGFYVTPSFMLGLGYVYHSVFG